ncbi:MAG: 4-hydroxy-tetrahydrodipicolinate synthase [Planctomycetes bacterium]|nr:4-hydroxy-tetrahydrodipicolinate synthase [Planctomycetota bacterium]
MIQFRGAYTALITPFTADGGAVDHDRIVAGVNRQADGGIAGVVPCGTTGETPTLSTDEYHRVIEHTIAAARQRGLAVIPGAGSNSTARAVEQHRFVASAGADAALQVTPYYNKPSQEGMYRHFMAIADSCDLPIVLYNIPGRTGVALTVETIIRLAAHPNVQAIKDATGRIDIAPQVVADTDLVVLSGDDPLTLPLALGGGSGVISIASNLVPDRVAMMCRAFLEGDWGTACSLHARLLPLARGLLTLDTNPVPLKIAMARLGWDTGAVRLPLCPPDDSVVRALDDLLEAQQVRAVGVPA